MRTLPSGFLYEMVSAHFHTHSTLPPPPSLSFYPSLSNSTLFDSLSPHSQVATPWVLSGDLCTLLPFVLFGPPRNPFRRHWLRVPLADGPGDRGGEADRAAHLATAADRGACEVCAPFRAPTRPCWTILPTPGG